MKSNNNSYVTLKNLNMKKNLLSLLLFVGVITYSAAQYTPHSWTLVIHSVGINVDGGYYTASACVGLEENGGLLANPSNPFSFYLCDNYQYTTNVMGCPGGLVFDPDQQLCNYGFLVNQNYWPNFPWEKYSI